MSKKLFEMMQAEQLASLYPTDFTKKEAVKTGSELTKKNFNEGNVDKLQYVANLARLEAVISSAMAEARNGIVDIEKTSVLGVEFNPKRVYWKNSMKIQKKIIQKNLHEKFMKISCSVEQRKK